MSREVMEPKTSRSGVICSTSSLPRSPNITEDSSMYGSKISSLPHRKNKYKQYDITQLMTFEALDMM